MSSINIYVPDVGSDGEVEVIEILVSKGDTVNVDDPIVVVESDKASIEVPASESGEVTELLVKIGDKVVQGDALLTLESSENKHAASPSLSPVTDPGEAQTKTETESAQQIKDATNPLTNRGEEPTDHGHVAAQAIHEVTVPDLGGATDVEVIELSASEGERLGIDDALVVIETDKASMDIPTTVAGELVELKVAIGDKVNEGDVLALFSVEQSSSGEADNGDSVASAGVSTDSGASDATTSKQATQNKSTASITTNESVPDALSNGTKVHAGPAVRKLARELGVELDKVKPSGPKGRIQKDDLNGYIKHQVQTAQSGQFSTGPVAQKLPDFSQFGEIETRKLEKLHLLTARNMQSSWTNVPLVTQFDEADITDLERFRTDKKEQAAAKQVKLTPLPFLIKSCAHALQALPQFNVSLDMENEQLIQKRYFNIGVAVDTSYGLVVPVVKDVLAKDLWQIAAELGALADKAKNRKLAPSDMQGACFTISSLGSIGGTAFTPIVNQPEVAILGVSKAQVKPVYNNGEFNPRLMLPLSLSYDHRAVNGADAARFTSLIAKYLSDIRELLF